MPEIVCVSLQNRFLLALCRKICADYSNGLPRPLSLVGLSSGEEEIRERKERTVRVFISQASALQAASGCLCPSAEGSWLYGTLFSWISVATSPSAALF